jgi:Zn-dependent protease/predicted transcriptional regulator
MACESSGSERTSKNRHINESDGGFMKWSWRIGRLAGIGVHVHATFLLLVALYAVAGWMRHGSIIDGMQIAGFLLALFACVVVHELGHALTARGFGIATRDITLLPIGGIARLERMPDKSRQEFWIALAGPIVSFALSAALFGIGTLSGAAVQFGLPGVNQMGFVQQLAAANLYLAVFNLIPAFPMDGGRILRALLAEQIGQVRATVAAARVGQGAAVLFGVAGLFFSPMLVLIAMFIWFAAAQEAAALQISSALKGIKVGRIMRADLLTLAPAAPLGLAAELSLSRGQTVFPIVERGRLLGIVTRDSLVEALRRLGPDEPVCIVMQKNVRPLEASDNATDALERFASAETEGTIPVLRHGRLVGSISVESFRDFAALGHAMATHHREKRIGNQRPETPSRSRWSYVLQPETEDGVLK